eukprot:5987624-Amphidinium_carterae.1
MIHEAMVGMLREQMQNVEASCSVALIASKASASSAETGPQSAASAHTPTPQVLLRQATACKSGIDTVVTVVHSRGKCLGNPFGNMREETGPPDAQVMWKVVSNFRQCRLLPSQRQKGFSSNAHCGSAQSYRDGHPSKSHAWGIPNFQDFSGVVGG